MLLRDSKYKAAANWPQLISLANEAKGKDRDGYRAGFISLAQASQKLQGK
jgi:Ca-activated chloride channel family protein